MRGAFEHRGLIKNENLTENRVNCLAIGAQKLGGSTKQ